MAVSFDSTASEKQTTAAHRWNLPAFSRKAMRPQRCRGGEEIRMRERTLREKHGINRRKSDRRSGH